MLVACAHGTGDPAGRRAIEHLVHQVRLNRPGLDVVPTYVDVQEPRLAAAVTRLAARGRGGVVVPLLLSGGYHVRSDVAGAVAASGTGIGHPAAPPERAQGAGAPGRWVAAPPLGPDGALADVLVQRLAACGCRPDDVVLLAAAGSRDARATGDVERAAALLAARIGRPVRTAYLAAGVPSVTDAMAEAVADARAQGGAVAVATYLMAPGRFADRLGQLARAAGVTRVGEPLAGHPNLARLVLTRYDTAAQDPAVQDTAAGPTAPGNLEGGPGLW